MSPPPEHISLVHLLVKLSYGKMHFFLSSAVTPTPVTSNPCVCVGYMIARETDGLRLRSLTFNRLLKLLPGAKTKHFRRENCLMVRPQQSRVRKSLFLFLAQPVASSVITSKREPLYVQQSHHRSWLTIPAKAQGAAGINYMPSSSVRLLKWKIFYGWNLNRYGRAE